MASLAPDILSQLLDYPSQPPPPGVMPNFVNPDSIAYQMYITAGVCISLMVVFSLLRFVSKIYYCRRAANVGEEIFFATGLVLCLAFIAMTIACVTEGAFGRHALDVTLGDFTKSQLVLDLLIESIGPLAICAVKISVLILYLRIFSVLNWMRIASIAGIVIITAWHLSMSIAFAAMCAPSPSAGTSQLDFLAADVSNTCSRTRVLVVLQGVSNIAIDLFLLVLPLPAIWRTQMPLRRKLTTSAMFSIGLCASVSSVIGLVYRVRFYRVGSDNTFLVVPLWATAIAEEAAGVIICCLPSTVIIFKSVKKSVLSWLSSVPLRLALQRKWPESSVNPKHSHLSSRSPRHILSDIEVDSYSLLQLNPGNTGIVKKTEWEVLRV